MSISRFAIDFGPVLGFEVRDSIPREILQAAIEDVDGVRGFKRSQTHGTIAHDLDGELSARCPPELLADGLGMTTWPLLVTRVAGFICIILPRM
jgi:hypothetical protein